MTLFIRYKSEAFPRSYSVRSSGTLTTSWDELLWSALTVGRPSVYHVYRHGPASFHEAIFRLSLIRMTLEQGVDGYLRKTDAFSALDPTEKGMVSYFVGMTLCKLFAWKKLDTPWLLHVDAFRPLINPLIDGRSRPDLVGQNSAGRWHAFETKGRSSPPSKNDIANAKQQAQRLVSVNRQQCRLHIGTFSFFRGKILEFFWKDPQADADQPIRLPKPKSEWRFYYEPIRSLEFEADTTPFADERQSADVNVEINTSIKKLIIDEQWREAYLTARKNSDAFLEEGFQPDGIRINAGPSWSTEYRPRSQ